MHEPQLRIFSYLPNPRIFKATITARLCGVSVEVRGAPAPELADWLWDFDAEPLDDALRARHAGAARTARTGFGGTLYKTDAFLAAHPWGTVPAAFSADGSIGVFESNSIMRAVARLGGEACTLYGDGPYSAARIDGFLDVSLVFARDSQVYLLALMHDELTPAIHAQTGEALAHWLGGIERALVRHGAFIAGDTLSLADICFAAELALFANECTRGTALARHDLAPWHDAALAARFPRALAHYARLCAEPAFAADLGPYLEKIAQQAASVAS